MVRLVLASATGLFLELALIRWAGSHLLYLSYVANFLLIAAFLGIGLGCLYAARRGVDHVGRMVAAMPHLLLGVVLLISLTEVEVVVNSPTSVYFGSERAAVALPAWAVLPLLGLSVTALFLSIGAAVGRELGRAAPLTAYTWDIVGSLVGIALLTLMSFLALPAEVWFACAGLAFLPLLPGTRAPLYAGGAAVLCTVAVVSWADLDSEWSPYYRVSVIDLGPTPALSERDPTAGTPWYRLKVNQITHQYIMDFRRREPFYELPYRAIGVQPPGIPDDRWIVDIPDRGVPPPTADPSQPHRKDLRVAIIGGGTGADTAFALAYGVAEIDVVEIDPLLAEIGRRLNPNRPYADPRVTVHIGDGRTFLERAPPGHYDLVIFGLPDSLTLASPYAGLRLESFLFTEESLRRALAAVHPEHGLLVLYNYYREPWLVRRIAATLTAANDGRAPKVLVSRDRNLAACLFAGPAQDQVPPDLAKDWGFFFVSEKQLTERATTTDDWPFPYLQTPEVPDHLLASMVSMIGFAFLAVFAVLAWTRRHAALHTRLPPTREALRAVAPFFFMGTAFLLLETAGLVRMSLLFGTTWLVNALVFFAVLCMVLLANLLAARFTLRRPLFIFAALFAALAVAWAIPPAAFAEWPGAARYATAAVLLFVPILLANLVFSRAFRETRLPALAFGSNLVGAVVGGALEYLSLALGYQTLFVVAAALYLAAAFTWRRADAPAAAEPSAPDAPSAAA